jgi:hypothetical protein
MILKPSHYICIFLGLLKLPKDSADTKMFEQFAKELEGTPTPASTPKTSTGIGTLSFSSVYWG